MALRSSQKGYCSFIPRSSAIRTCALVVLCLCTSISTAARFEELSVAETNGEYRLRIVALLNAPADYVHDVITDYKHAYRINPSIIKIEILPFDHNHNNVVRLRNLSEHRVGPFCFDIHWVGDILEDKAGIIKIKTVPELSSFKSGSAIWEIRPRGESTWVLHESRLKPDFFIPPVIGDTIMKNKMRTDTQATFKRIECQAIAMFERDMEADTDLLKRLSNEERDCMKPEG